MEQRIQRIAQMEQICNRGIAAVEALIRAAQDYQTLAPQLHILEEYYLSPQWLADRDADQAGQIPRQLSRGILAEDTVYDLLTDIARMKQLLQTLCREAAENPESHPKK